MRAKVVTVMRWYAQDEVNQEDSEQNEVDVDGMKKEADSRPQRQRSLWYHRYSIFLSRLSTSLQMDVRRVVL